jgi:tetratricopeptide (TPR) repeat protein
VSDNARNLSRRVDRFMQLPRRSTETWQGGVLGLPLFAAAPGSGEPVRQWAIAWANLATGDVSLSSATPAEALDRDRVLDAFLDLGLRNRKAREGRPARIEVRDASLGAFVKDALRDPDLEVVVLRALPRIDQEIDDIVRSEHDGPPPPGALDAAGVDLARMRAFAEAARLLYGRAPWNDLGHDDLVVVEAPAAPEGMACFVVMDEDPDVGLEFFASVEQFEAEQGEHEGADSADARPGDGADADADADEGPQWSLDYVRIDQVPVRDVGLWADTDLPVAGSAAYPVVIRPVGPSEFERPDAARLAFVERLLRALAATSEADIDSGRWVRTVDTPDGAVDWRFSIPSLLDEPREGRASRDEEERSAARLSRYLAEGGFDDVDQAAAELERLGASGLAYPEPQTPLERAQDLVYRAGGAPGRRRTQLLREAVALSSDCLDAYVHLGESTRDAASALELFEAGREAAERVVPPDILEGLKGRYWTNPKTRSLLRGLFGRATALHDLGRVDEAAAAFKSLMFLDEEDHAGAGYHLLAILLEEGRDAEALTLLGDYDDDGPEWGYGWTLWAFRNQSRSDASEALRVAQDADPTVARLLAASASTGSDDDVDASGPEHDDVDDEAFDRAVDCAALLESAWASTPGATEWLAAELARQRERRRGNRSRRRPRGGPRRR